MENNLKKIAYERRLEVLEMVYRHKSGHIGGSMSCMDILTTLYFRVMDTKKIKEGAVDRDRFVLSKGHNAEALYAILAHAGFFPKEELDTFTTFGTHLAEHPTRLIPGIEVATGALGHGVSVAVGMAIGNKAGKQNGHIYTLTGDGELAEGSVWEALMSAAKYRLDNFTLIIDRNRLQISGGTEAVMPLDDLQKKLEAFGFYVIPCDGHDYDVLEQALLFRKEHMPVAVIANTIKGKGSYIMENKADWHHHVPSETEYLQIKQDLEKTAGGM